VTQSMTIRWVALVLWLPLSLLIGGVASDVIARPLGVWSHYIGAVLLPAVGLVGAWWIAPDRKPESCIAFYLVGIALAYALFCPDSYPESHPNAYEPTYVPFWITVTVATGLLVVLTAGVRWWDERRSTAESVS